MAPGSELHDKRFSKSASGVSEDLAAGRVVRSGRVEHCEWDVCTDPNDRS